jgi:hypothetical protein
MKYSPLSEKNTNFYSKGINLIELCDLISIGNSHNLKEEFAKKLLQMEHSGMPMEKFYPSLQVNYETNFKPKPKCKKLFIFTYSKNSFHL